MNLENTNQQIQNNNQENNTKSTRSFKVKLEQNGVQYGRYNGDSPYQAANKALSEIIRNKVKSNQSTNEDINFYLIESTKGSNKKVHNYIGKRIKLQEPVTYRVDNGQIITKEFKNILRKVKKSELIQQGGDLNIESSTVDVDVEANIENTNMTTTLTQLQSPTTSTQSQSPTTTLDI